MGAARKAPINGRGTSKGGRETRPDIASRRRSARLRRLEQREAAIEHNIRWVAGVVSGSGGAWAVFSVLLHSGSGRVVNDVALALLVAISSGLLYATLAPLECLMMILRPVLRWTVGEDDLHDGSDSETSSRSASNGVIADQVKAAGTTRSGRAKAAAVPSKKGGMARRASHAQAKAPQDNTGPEIELENTKTVSNGYLSRSCGDSDAMPMELRCAEAPSDWSAVDSPSHQGMVELVEDIHIIGLTILDGEQHPEKRQRESRAGEPMAEARAADETLNAGAWGDDEANVEVETKVDAEDWDAAASGEDEDAADVVSSGALSQHVRLDEAAQYASIETGPAEMPAGVEAQTPGRHHACGIAMAVTTIDASACTPLDADESPSAVPMFQQPPGLEVESATVIERLLRRNMELEEMLARTSVPPGSGSALP